MATKKPKQNTLTKQQAETLDLARAYMRDYASYGHAIPSLKGLAKIVRDLNGTNRRTFYKWRDTLDEFKELLEDLNDEQELALLHGGLTNQLNSNIVKLALGKHGYSDKQQQEVTGKDGEPLGALTTVVFKPVGHD